MYETKGGNAMTFGERMRKRRNEIGKTLAEIANEIGKTESTVQRYENDVIKSIGYDVVCALADALHTTPAYLVGWDEKKPASFDEKRAAQNIEMFNRLSPEQQEEALKFLRYLSTIKPDK
jgi:transcriptional regulator with XRE-family HTH domain